MITKNGKYFIKTTTKQQKLIHNYIQRSVMVNNPQIKKKIFKDHLQLLRISCYSMLLYTQFPGSVEPQLSQIILENQCFYAHIMEH